MASSINTNMASLIAQRNLSGSQSALATSVERLSSGVRINRARDDAAGLAISAQLSKQIGAVNLASRNANDAISMIQTAEGALDEVATMLQKMKELATQGSNAALSDSQRKNIADEVNQMKTEINKVADRTTFNGNSLLTGGANTLSGALAVGQLGSEDVGITSITVGSAKAQTYNFTNSTDKLTLTGADGVSQTLTVAGMSAGGTQTLNFDALGVKVELAASKAETGTDIAAAFTAIAGPPDFTVTAGAASYEFQTGAGASDTMTLTGLTNIKLESANTNASNAFKNLDTSVSAFSGGGTSTVDEAQDLMAKVDEAILAVANQRADLGAQQNRLENNIANLMSQSENLSAARGRIMDTDYATETASLTKGQIMQQASAAMLAQANQMPQVILSLLK